MDNPTEIHFMIKHPCLNIGARIIFLTKTTVPFRCSSITYVSHLRTCFISYRFIFLHRSCEDGRLSQSCGTLQFIVAQAGLSIPCPLGSCWDLQCSRSHAYAWGADHKIIPSLGHCALETMDHSCSTLISGQASNNAHCAAPKTQRGGRESGDSPCSSQ